MSSPFLRSFLAHAGRRVVVSAALALALALVEAASLLLLVPLVELLGLGQVRAAASLGNVWRNVFASLGIPANFELVLAAFIGLLVVQAGLRRVSDQLNARIEASYAAHLRDRLYEALVHARWLAFTRLRAADITRTLTQEVDHASFAAQQGLSLVGICGLACVHVTMAAVLSPRSPRWPWAAAWCWRWCCGR